MRKSEFDFFPAHFDSISLEAAKFVFRQSEELLKDTLEVRRSLELKTVGLLAGIVPAFLGLLSVRLGFFAIELSKEAELTLTVSLVMLLIALAASLLLLIPKTRYHLGSEPAKMFCSDWHVHGEDYELKAYVLNEASSYQKRIVENIDKSTKDANLFTFAATLSALSPTLIFIVSIL